MVNPLYRLIEYTKDNISHLSDDVFVDGILIEESHLCASVRMHNLESMERNQSSALSLRVIIDGKAAIISSEDLAQSTLEPLADKAIEMAKNAPQDPYLCTANKQQWGKTEDSLQLYDDTTPSEETLISLALEAETTALNDKAITNSEGADATAGNATIQLANSKGFDASYRSSNYSLSVGVIAENTDGMERDYAYCYSRNFAGLTDPSVIGEEAALRTKRRLSPQKISSDSLPVIFDPRIAKSLVSSIGSAMNGASIAKGTSFLTDAMGKYLFASSITLVDDPRKIRGLASRPFDGEGVKTAPLTLIHKGTLENWLLDLRSAKKLGLETTGHATRGLGGPPSPSYSNLYIQAGEVSPESLITSIDKGVYITDCFGMGINLITGDYSQGASGFLIEKGTLTHPISEITIASNLTDMFSHMIPANDLTFKYAVNSPTLYIDKMTVAGA